MKKDINVEMGARVKEKRKDLNYTREVLAELVDISPQFLANIESGKKGMSFATLTKLCKCLGVSCDYIVLGKTPDNQHDRISEIVANIDDKYIPLVEDMLGTILQVITTSQNNSDTETD